MFEQRICLSRPQFNEKSDNERHIFAAVFAFNNRRLLNIRYSHQYNISPRTLSDILLFSSYIQDMYFLYCFAQTYIPQYSTSNMITQGICLMQCLVGCSDNIKNHIFYYADSKYGALTYIDQKSKEKKSNFNFLVGCFAI